MKLNNKLPIIVSLTSIHSRLDLVSQTIESLLAQSVKADKVVLWLSKEPHLLDDGVKEVPESIKQLEKQGLEVKWTKNIGPYRKLIPTAKLMNRESCLIVTADDDVVYPENWLKGLIVEYNKNEGCVICYRGRIMSKSTAINKWLTNKKLKPYMKWLRTHEVKDKSQLGPNFDIFPTGKDGVLYPSEKLHEELFNKSIYLTMAPTNDDIWFKAMTMITGTKVKCIENHLDFPETESARNSRLFAFKNKKRNDRMIHQIFERYKLL